MVTFYQDIEPMFSRYVGCMSKVQVASEDGVEPAQLGDYDFVKRFHNRILVRLKGVNEFGQVVPRMPPPPAPAFADDKIALFEKWIAEGMAEGTKTEVV